MQVCEARVTQNLVLFHHVPRKNCHEMRTIPRKKKGNDHPPMYNMTVYRQITYEHGLMIPVTQHASCVDQLPNHNQLRGIRQPPWAKELTGETRDAALHLSLKLCPSMVMAVMDQKWYSLGNLWIWCNGVYYICICIVCIFRIIYLYIYIEMCTNQHYHTTIFWWDALQWNWGWLKDCVPWLLKASKQVFHNRFWLQWHHCLRTYCNKNFRGWIAGFNAFSRLIEIRTLGCPGILAAGSYSPLTGINIQNIDYWYMKARSTHARSKQTASATGLEPMRLASLNAPAWARHQPDSLEAIWLQMLPLAGVWFVLACLACAALFRAPKSKNFSAPKKLLPPPLCNLSPGIMKYLAYSSVWNACTWKTFRDLKKLFGT